MSEMSRTFSIDIPESCSNYYLVIFIYYLHCIMLGVNTMLKGHYLGRRAQLLKNLKNASSALHHSSKLHSW